MKKFILTAGLVLTIAIPAMALQVADNSSDKVQSTDKLVEVGNKFCPVSGEQVGKMGPAVKYTYNGKVYNLCCPMCRKDFQKDPEKFSKIAEDNAAKLGKYEGK